MRLPPRPDERIDRDQPVAFSFNERLVSGFAGDTIGSALFASGRRVFSRSFKYHRPRGLLCCSGQCANCMMAVDGVPNVRVCVEPLRPGAQVRGQNVLGSLERDLLGVTDKVGGPFTPVGFYYRTMIRPRRAWPLYERFLRNVAGLGRIDKHGLRSRRYDTENLRTDVLVIGGGEAGLDAARTAAGNGDTVLLVDDGLGAATPPADEGFEVLAPARAIGVYEGGLVPVDAGDVLYRVRARRIVVATGTLEQPLVFPGNDLVGVVLPNAVRRLLGDWAIRPGERAVVITADDRGLEAAEALRAAGTHVRRVLDLRERPVRQIEAAGKRGLLQGVTIDGERDACDLLVMSGGIQPAYSLLAQAGGKVEYDAGRGIFVPAGLPAGVEAAGSVAGSIPPQALPAASYGGSGKCFVCPCEDVTVKDVKRAIAEGFDSIELAKRYTTVTMGPCQGRLCHLASIRLFARATHSDEESIGTTTARPPWQPVSLGLLAGRGHEPRKHTALHHRHEELGATVMWTGEWRRPHSYGDAAAFLERLYPNRFADLAVGRIRYAVLGTDAGRIMDDGTVARLGDEEFYVTTTSTGADVVAEWFEWWNAVWQLDVAIVNVTGALAAVNVAGPHVRELMARISELDVSAEGFKYLDAKRALVADVPCLLLRIGFVGELGYELHCPSPYAEHLWDTVLEQGADLGIRPFGLEPQRVLRLEKMHVLVGQDTDSESNALEAGMPWIVKFDKDDFVGKWSLEHVQERGFRERLVGFEMSNGTVPAEGGQIVVDGRPGGRVTSARWSDTVGKAIGLAWVPPDLAEEDATLQIRVNGSMEEARVRLTPFFDPDGERLRS